MSSALLGVALAFYLQATWSQVAMAATAVGALGWVFGIFGAAGACLCWWIYPHWFLSVLGAAAGGFLGLCLSVDVQNAANAASGPPMAAAGTGKQEPNTRAAVGQTLHARGARAQAPKEPPKDRRAAEDPASARGGIVEAASGLAADPRAQVTAASAAGGAVALGVGGGAVGMTTGGVLGAAVGIVPAFFTFGLSIPVGAAVGAATGLGVGTAVGGTAGLVGGGAAGYSAFGRREQIRNVAGNLWSQAHRLRAVATKAVNGAKPE